MTEYKINNFNDTTVDVKDTIIKHDNESDFLTFTCKKCGEILGVFIGVENLILLNKLINKHTCNNANIE